MSRKIILASGSPRRRALLARMGVTFEPVVSDFAEQLDDTRDVHDVARELALGKARAVAAAHPEVLVIGADTIIVFAGKQLGKQPDEAAARALLRRLSGQSIEVITGVALVCHATGTAIARTETATITFEPYDDAVINAYLAAGEWHDKAGAVAVQSQHTPPIARITGPYDTALGLATGPLAELLREQGIAARQVHLQHEPGNDLSM